MVYELSSNNLSVKINSKGAEICSVVKDGREYIWQAKPDVWPRHAPCLFPIVGRLKENKFTYRGSSYSLPQHGFARDMEFTCVDNKISEISFELQTTNETRRNFPFDFKFVIIYKVEDDTIVCSYAVNNCSEETMYFSVGAHPGFRTDDLNKCTLRFTGKHYKITLLEDGLISEKKEELDLSNGELRLNTTLFERDALVFENGQIDSIQLVSRSGSGVELNCKDWPYFGIWTKKTCNEFICLEPWHGITDMANSNGDLTQKKGIIKLEVEKKFECSFALRFF